MNFLSGKLIFIIILAIIFLTFFGHPSLKNYQANETLISEKKVQFKPGDSPAITIAVREEKGGHHGWKAGHQSDNVFIDMIGHFCSKFTSFNETVQCINDKTYNLSEVVENAETGMTTLNGPSSWNTDIFFFFYAKVNTLQSSYEIGTNWLNSLVMTLNKSQAYYVWIHDRKFFLTSTNEDVIPHLFFKIEKSEHVWLNIRPIYHHMMNKPGQRCDPSESYSFTECIKNTISRRIGCRLEWDHWSSGDIPLCTTLDQLFLFQSDYYNISEMWQQSEIAEYTGCLVPCHYTEYQLAGEPFRYETNSTNISLILSSRDILSKTELRIYSLQSFIAEFGGALSLFLGFSFIMLWDGLKIVGEEFLDWFNKMNKNDDNVVTANT